MEATRGAGPEGPAPRPAIVAPEARFETVIEVASPTSSPSSSTRPDGALSGLSWVPLGAPSEQF